MIIRKNPADSGYRFPNKYLTIASVLVILFATLIPRLWKIDQFVTVDEPRWLTRSANFLLAMRTGDWANTYQKEHPGVTVMWIGAAGHIWAGHGVLFLNEAYFTNPANIERFLSSKNESALARLTKGRILLVLSITAVILLSFLYAVRLFGWQVAFFGFLLVSLDPFLIAHQRLLHLDGILSALVLLSVLAWGRYLYQGRRWVDLGVSAVAAGFGFLTKSPALIIIPVIGLLGLLNLPWYSERKNIYKKFLILLRDGFIWLGILTLVVITFWPAIWINPINTIRDVISGAIGYAEAGHAFAVFFDGDIINEHSMPWYFYPTAYAWRSSPIVLIGLLFAAIIFLLRRRSRDFRIALRNLLPVLLFVVIFLVVMMSGNKQFDRYILPLFAPLDIIAGFGFWHIFQRFLAIRGSVRTPGKHLWSLLGVVALIFIILVTGSHVYNLVKITPYYITYYNPILSAVVPVERVMMIGWGEGLDRAARYLNEIKDAEKLRVLSWYPDGCFSYYFVGETNRTDMPENIHDLPKVHYIVLYQHQFQRNLPSASFLAYFESLEPESTIVLNGIEYVKIYRIPDSAYDNEGKFQG